MKYSIVGVEHKVGDFTPRDGKNAGVSQHFDLFNIHAIRNNGKIVGGKECVVIRTTPSDMGDIIAACGGTIEQVPGHVFDMEVRYAYGKTSLGIWELLK